VINIAGEVVPIVDARLWAGEDQRPPAFEDQLLMVRTDVGRFGISVDSVLGVLQDEIELESLGSNSDTIKSFLVDEDGVVLIIDVAKFFRFPSAIAGNEQ
jgi:chemotaxis signal transduction protein